MAEHMPKPWQYDPLDDCDGERWGRDHFVIDANGDEVACPPDEATARLLAAAPKMLADHAFFLIRQGRDSDDVVDTLVKRYGVTKDSARAVIASEIAGQVEGNRG